jgi:D-mannonate dehydratase
VIAFAEFLRPEPTQFWTTLQQIGVTRVVTFHDDGLTDMPACMEAWHEFEFDGVLRPDHVPTLAGDSNADPAYSNLGRLHALGYMTGLREAARRHAEGPGVHQVV